MPNITFLNIVSYLESLAEKHVGIKSNFRWNIEEAGGAMRSGIEYPVMLIDPVEVKTEGDYSKLFHYNNTAITILAKPSTRQGNQFESQNEVLNECQQICFDLENRIINDSRSRIIEEQKNWLYNLVDINSFQFFKMGPLFTDNLYGYRLEIQIKNSVIKEIDKDKWTDLQQGYPYTYPFKLG